MRSAQLGDLIAQSDRPRAALLDPAEQLADALERARHVVEATRLEVVERQTRRLELRQLAAGVAVVPGQHEIGLQQQDALDVEALVVADPRHRARLVRKRAQRDRADERGAATDRVHELGQVRRQRDHPLRRVGRAGTDAQRHRRTTRRSPAHRSTAQAIADTRYAERTDRANGKCRSAESLDRDAGGLHPSIAHGSAPPVADRSRSAAANPPRPAGSRRRTRRRGGSASSSLRAARPLAPPRPSSSTTWSARSQARFRSCRLTTTAPPFAACPRSTSTSSLLVAEVEVRRRLVEQQQRRLLQQRGRDRDALSLAAGERPHVGRGEFGELESRHQRAHRIVRLRSLEEPCLVPMPCELHGVEDAARKRIAPELRAPGATLGQRARLPVVQRLPVDRDIAGRAIEHAGQRGEQRRLAGTVRTEDDPAFARSDLEAEPLEEPAPRRAMPPARKPRVLTASSGASACSGARSVHGDGR